MRILVTGASGLLGLNLALEAAKDHEVFGTVKDHAITTDAFSVLQTDLLVPGAVERLLDKTKPDWIIHCAALANVDACEANPALARQLNSELPKKLATYVGRGGARLVHVSTDAVFDGQRGDYTEEDLPNPLSVYAQSKLDGERAVAEANPRAIIARVNLFGWSLTGKRSLAEFFFYNLSAGKRVMGFTDVYFCPLLANHLARVFLKMLASDLNGLYHVVSRDCFSKYDFGMMIAQRFDLDESLITPSSVEGAGLKAARSPKLTLRTDKLTQDLCEPPPGLSTGIEHFYTLYQQGYPQKIQKLGNR
ncbi:MAG: SDR family oxidoreductase [Anaerolineales bacterium]|nr:SDR family oxidoreductase [Anaerolineales bacterium]